ncbi:MAG: efflux RND transporter periplasmic adaptor subunit [Candidatus Krumholzibacteria bacterium]|nr:efflux RND transporter periplasmic adaptor subunit [Candidatus Krumholzibacteria bacterium]
MDFINRISPRARTGLLAGAVVVAFIAGFLLRGGGGTPEREDAAAPESVAGVWTCSMHPQIRLPQPGKCPICFMDLIPVPEGTAEDEGERRLAMSESAMKLAGIETSPVERRRVHARVRAVGEVEYDETRLADIASWVPGRIERLFVNFTGAPVRRGDPLAEIYSPQLVSAQEELVQAKRSFDAAAPGGPPAAATLESVREKLRLLGMTPAQIESVEQSGEVRRNVVTHAPSSGVVVEIGVREGQYVQTGTRLMRIADLSRVWIVLRAYQSDLALLRRGQEVSFTATALPGSAFTGTLEFVDPVLDPKTMTAGVRAAAANGEGRLRPGMYVSGEILAEVAADGTVASEETAGEPAPLVIPATAPLLTGTRAVVYVRLAGERPVFEGREVVLGPRVGEYYVVLEGLAGGELVVTAGAFRIDSELQIRAQPSMMSPEGGAAPAAHDHAGQTGARPSERPGIAAGDHAHEGKPETAVSQDALEALAPMYDAYFDAQMALARDDLDEAKAAYARVKRETGAVDMTLFAGKAHEDWMTISGAISARAAEGAGAVDIAAARDAFFHLSRSMIDLEEEIGHAGGDFWLTFCPMAQGNAGAFWIQEVDTVYNSFYGKMMLRCGSIERKLPAAGSGD